MAMIVCPKCGMEFSDSMGECFGCGYVYKKESAPMPKPQEEKPIKIEPVAPQPVKKVEAKPKPKPAPKPAPKPTPKPEPTKEVYYGEQKSWAGIASLVFGIIGFFTGIFVIGLAFDAIAILLGLIAIISKKQKSGLGVAGLVIGGLGIIVTLFVVKVLFNTGTPNAPEDTPERTIGEAWVVDGEWSVVINSVRETSERNPYSDDNPKAVYMVNYTYSNIGYKPTDGIVDGLYISLDEGIVDSAGMMGYSYPNDISKYPTEVPVGASCTAEVCIGVDNPGNFKIYFDKYDDNTTKHSVIFNLSTK